MSKHRKPAPKASAPPNVQRPISNVLVIPPFFKNTLLQSGLIFAFAFLLYSNTLMHGFVLDDSIVITENMFTEKGVEGIPGILSKDTFFGYFKVEGKAELVAGGRYRPLTLVLFAFVYQFFGENAFGFHLFTVLLFAATCAVLYQTLLLLFRPRFSESYTVMLAWMAAVLFAAHPIHTEVVANIKGCDEIATLLGSLGALFLAFKFYDSRKIAWGLAAGLMFFLACLSKENAVTFLAVVPLALWFFRTSLPRTTPPPNGRGVAAHSTSPLPFGGGAGGGVVRTCLPLLLAFVAFFILRGFVLDWPQLKGREITELMNNPFMKIEANKWVHYAPAEKLATVFYTLWKYVQLLFVPHPLTHDYYPRHIGLMTFRDPGALLGLLFHLFLVGYACAGIRRRDPVRFGILYYLLTLSIVSNLVFPVGTNMGERLAFMPSVGFCISAAALFLHFFAKKTNLALGIFGAVILLFSFKTVVRNFAWESNEKLFFTDVNTSANSAKIQNGCGGVLLDQAKKDTANQRDLCLRAITHFDKAIKTHPTYKDAFFFRGECHFLLKQYDLAVADFRETVRVAPEDPRMKINLAQVLRETGKHYGEQKKDLAAALRHLTESWQYNTKDPETARLLGVANGVQGKYADAVMWFSKAVELAPDNALLLFDLGMTYRAAGDLAKGDEALRKALEINPKIGEERRMK